jgi:hypothetical protein
MPKGHGGQERKQAMKKCNLKALGRALGMVLAIMAMAATGARAEKVGEFSAAEYPAQIDITNSGEGEHTFSIEGLPTLTCAQVNAYVVEQEKDSSQLTAIEPEYSTCHLVSLGITFPITFDMNGCDLLLTAGTFTPSATEGVGASDGDLHIKCPSEEEITITVFKSGSTKHTAEDLRCTMHIAPQTPGSAGAVTYQNETKEGKEALTVQADNLGIKTAITESTLCGKERTVTALYSGSVWAQATSSGGSLIGLKVQAQPEEEIEEKTDFSAEGTHIDGVAAFAQTFTVGGLSMTCTSLTNTAVIPEQTPELTLENIAYSNCHVVVLGVTFPITVYMNGCTYLLTGGIYTSSGTKGSGAAVGSIHIKCPESKQIEVKIYKAGSAHTSENVRCVIDITGQTPSSGSIDYNNELIEGVMATTAQATNIVVRATKTKTGTLCPEEETVNSTYNGSIWMQATNAAHTAYVDITVIGTP